MRLLNSDMLKENMFYHIKWIPTAEREPEENNEYLVTVFLNGETYVDIDDYSCYGWDFYRDKVIAWAELPEPYRKEQTELTVDMEMPIRHAEWRPHPIKGCEEWDVCSACGIGTHRRLVSDLGEEEYSYSYCPWCGAKMDGERKDGAV